MWRLSASGLRLPRRSSQPLARLLCAAVAAAALHLGLRSRGKGGSCGGFVYQAPPPSSRRSFGRSARFAEPSPSHRLADGTPIKCQKKRTKKSAVALALGVPDVREEELTAMMLFAGRCLLGALGVTGGLVALLYITSWFEGLMHSASGVLIGQSVGVAAATGVAVGTLHTVAGPDHLAGLAPLVIGQRRSPAAAFGLGALWGSGHATGQLLIGLACLAVQMGLLRTSWSSAFGQASGVLVGASLVAIGLLGLHEAQQFEAEGGLEAAAPRKRRFGWATYATGVLHGLSPDAVLFVAPALALPRAAAASHVAGVVAGTLLAMGTCTALLSALCRRSPRVKLISTSASSVAMLLGACILAAALGFTAPLPGL